MPKRRLPEFLRPPEAKALLAAAGGGRDGCIVGLGLYCGLRVSEVTKLRVEDIDFDGRTVFIRQAKGKKDRYVPIPEDFVLLLQSWVGARVAGWLFPSRRFPDRHLTTRAVQQLMDRLKIKAGIARRLTPHVLRHTMACSLLRAGADICEIQQLLGHGSIQVTSRYLHVEVGRLKSVVDRLKFSA